MWMDFMRAAIAGKDKETFPVADEPKKVLAVPVGPGDAPKKPAAEEPDPDDPDGATKLIPAQRETPPIPPVTVPVAPPPVTPPPQ
jgi:hypothetical protein